MTLMTFVIMLAIGLAIGWVMAELTFPIVIWYDERKHTHTPSNGRGNLTCNSDIIIDHCCEQFEKQVKKDTREGLL